MAPKTVHFFVGTKAQLIKMAPVMLEMKQRRLAFRYIDAGQHAQTTRVLRESFGLPPLEALSCGTPVVASNTSSMPEILGDAALLVSPTSVEAIADALGRILTTPSLAEELRERGLERSRTFSWERTARETIDVYERVAAI